jgi:hypothetical protein
VGGQPVRIAARRAAIRTLAQPAVTSVETGCGHSSVQGHSVRRVTLSSSDVAAIRSAEKALASAFEASDPTGLG